MHELCLVVIVLLLIICITMHMGSAKAHVGINKGEKTVIRFHRPKCPWCIRSQPDWDSFKANAHKINVATRDCNMEEGIYDAELRKYGGQGVPYIVKVHNGQVTVYNGDRSAKDLMAFAKQ